MQGCSCQRQENHQLKQPPSVATGSPCLPARGSPSLTPRLSIPCLPDGQETSILGQPCWPPPAFSPLLHGHCITKASARSSAPGYSVKKGTRLPLPMALGSFQLPVRPSWGWGWCYLICPVDCWQLSRPVAEEGEGRSVPWSGRFLVQTSKCSTKQPPSITMGSPCPHALPSLPLLSWLLICQPGLAQSFLDPFWAGNVTNGHCQRPTCCDTIMTSVYCVLFIG